MADNLIWAGSSRVKREAQVKLSVSGRAILTSWDHWCSHWFPLLGKESICSDVSGVERLIWFTGFIPC